MTLSALLILLFFLPGFIFNLSYYNSDNIPLNISVTHRAIASLFITVLLHGLGIITVVWFLQDNIDFDLILRFIGGVAHDADFALSRAAILGTVIYCISLYLFAYLAGIFFRYGIKNFDLERKSFFQIDNPWYYLFKGYSWEEGMPDGVKIAATMEIAKESYLYVGVLENFYLNKEGHLDRIVLESASRRLLGSDRGKVESGERFYPITGHYLVLKYNEIKNLNIEYFNILEIRDELAIQYVAPLGRCGDIR